MDGRGGSRHANVWRGGISSDDLGWILRGKTVCAAQTHVWPVKSQVERDGPWRRLAGERCRARPPCRQDRATDGWKESSMSIIARPARLVLSAGLAALVAGAEATAVGMQDRAPAVAPVTGFASVRGVVADRFGGPLPGVDVILTNDQSGERRTAKTAADASFEFVNLPGGTYLLEASRDGFARAYRDVTLKDDETSAQAMTMQVATLEETLRVVSGREPVPGSDGS